MKAPVSINYNMMSVLKMVRQLYAAGGYLDGMVDQIPERHRENVKEISKGLFELADSMTPKETESLPTSGEGERG
jgi:hypothetical protein